jgi:hypothetical protein
MWVYSNFSPFPLENFFFFEQAKMEYILKPKEKFQAQGVLEKTQKYTITKTTVRQTETN